MTTTPIADKISPSKNKRLELDGPTIGEAIIEITRSYHSLVDVLAELSNRLSPVLVSRPTEPELLAGVVQMEHGDHSQVFMQLVEHNGRLGAVHKQVADLLRDVQL